MCSHPARDVYSNRCNFPTLRVYTSQTLDSKGVDAKIRHGPNQDFFQIAYVAMHVFAIGAEIDDWITNHLAQPVISNFAAPICFKDADAARRQQFGRHQNSRTIPAPAHR